MNANQRLVNSKLWQGISGNSLRHSRPQTESNAEGVRKFQAQDRGPRAGSPHGVVALSFGNPGRKISWYPINAEGVR